VVIVPLTMVDGGEELLWFERKGGLFLCSYDDGRREDKEALSVALFCFFFFFFGEPVVCAELGRVFRCVCEKVFFLTNSLLKFPSPLFICKNLFGLNAK